MKYLITPKNGTPFEVEADDEASAGILAQDHLNSPSDLFIVEPVETQSVGASRAGK